MNNSLKRCPFCGSRAHDAGSTVQSCNVSSVRCTNHDCLASFKSVDAGVWNSRPDITPSLNAPAFELLMRRFSVAPPGERRQQAKQAVLNYVIRAVEGEGDERASLREEMRG